MPMEKNPVRLQREDTGQGRPVLLIHGFPLCRRMWRPQIPALVAAGCRVIAPDLRGFGETPPERCPVRMETYADDLVALLDELGIEQAVVGGMSMGGYVLMSLLERHPQRVSAALFLVTRAAADDPAAKERRKLLADEALLTGPGKIADAFESVLFGAGIAQTRPELVAEVRSWMLATPPGGMAAGLLAMRERKDFIDQLAGFGTPSLVIGADQDLAIPLGHSVVLAKGLPQATLKVVEGAGHLANLEKPDIFNRYLVEFLREL